MKQFIAKFVDQIQGVICGFDRVVFRGSLRALYSQSGRDQYMRSNGVLNKDFGGHANAVSEMLKEASLEEANKQGRPVKYLASAGTDKEAIAREIAKRDQVKTGLVCVLKCVEPCKSFQVYRNRETKKLDLELRQRKCLHLYHYWMDPELGFGHSRIQTWFPFQIQVCLNGREWLAQQMDRAGLQYVRQENCFPWVADYDRAQQLLDEQLKVNWATLLGGLARKVNPVHEEIFRHYRVQYYWSTYQSEWANDIVFRDAETLRRLYPKLVHHGITKLGCTDVMRYLGRRVKDVVPANFEGEVRSDVREREEGVRLKHWVNGNSLKIYDKASTPVGNVVRVEAMIQQERDFPVYRPKEGDPDGEKSWRPLRRGIADLHRRAEVSQRANDRYLDALSEVEDSATVEELTKKLEQPAELNQRRVRGLRLFEPADGALLEAVMRGEFTINGLRNRDLQRLLFPTPTELPEENRRRSSQISRKLRLLVAHGLIYRVQQTHRYQLTVFGRRAIGAVLAARQASVAKLNTLAA